MLFLRRKVKNHLRQYKECLEKLYYLYSDYLISDEEYNKQYDDYKSRIDELDDLLNGK